MTETKALTKQESATVETIPPGAEDVIVIARDPAEMEVAQRGLIAWAEAKIAEIERDKSEIAENLEIARASKWRVAPWKTRLRRAERQVEFYRKVKAALEAGYCIVPNFPVDVFAIRTTRDKPVQKEQFGQWVNDQNTNSPPEGVGDYVDPAPLATTDTREKEDRNGKMTKIHYSTPVEFTEVDFPFAVAKPQILKDTDRAMKKKIFDELGALPPRRRRGDPVIVGRVVLREGYSEKIVTFLVSWFIDTRAL